MDCVKIYHTIIDNCRLSSNWVEEVDGDLPPIAGLSPAMKLTEVRRMLQRQGRMSEACAILKTESDRYDGDLELMPYRELLDQYSRVPKTSGEARLNRLASTRTFFAQKLAEQGHKIDAERELEQASREVRRTLPSNMSLENYNPRLDLLMRRVTWENHMPEGLAEQAEGATLLGRRAENIKDFVISRSFLVRAHECAKELARHDWEDEKDRAMAVNYRDRLFQRYLSYEEETMGSAYFLARALTEAGYQMVISQRAKPGEFLDYLNDFDTRFPEFNVPSYLERLLFFRIGAAEQIGEHENLRKFKKKYESIRCQCHFEKIEEDADRDVRDDEFWEKEWMISTDDESGFWIANQKVAMKLLLRWVKSENSKGLLTMQDARRLLRLVRGDEADTFSEVTSPSSSHILKSLEPDMLSDIIFGLDEPTSPTLWDPWFAVIDEWLRRDALPPGRHQRHHLLKWLQHCRVMSYALFNHRKGFPTDKVAFRQMLVEHRKYRDLLRSLDRRAATLDEMRAEDLYRASNIASSGTFPNAKAEGLITQDMLDEAQTILEDAIVRSQIEGQLQKLHTLKMTFANVMWLKYFHFRSVPITAGLPLLHDAETINRQMRMENSMLTGSRSFFARHTLTERLSSGFIYSSALKISVAAWFDRVSEQRAKNVGANAADVGLSSLQDTVCQWVQWSKSRSLTDLMGLEAKIPSNIMAEVDFHADALRLLKEEDDILLRIRDANINAKMDLRQRLSNLRKQMRGVDALLPILNIREGSAIDLSEIEAMNQDFGGNVVFVDWVRISWLDAWDLAMVIYRGGTFELVPLTIKLSEVEDWVKDQLNTDSPLTGRSATNQLRVLNPLVKPLKDFTEPGQVLVFCPTKVLHRTPLHALKLGKELLIERNPIVYCQSLSVLRFCQMSSKMES